MRSEKEALRICNALGVVDTAEILGAQGLERVIPVVGVDEVDRTKKKNPGVWGEPGTGGVKTQPP